MVFDYLTKIQPEAPATEFNKILSAIAKMKQYSIVVHLFKKMLLLGCTFSDYAISIVTLCFCKLERVDLGFAILAFSFKVGVVPRTSMYTSLIHGLFMENKSSQGIQLFEKLILGRNFQVDRFIPAIIIDGLFKSGHASKNRMVDAGNVELDLFVYGIIESLCMNRMVDAALNLL
ncbi:hypothetical protein Leryth_017952 [Lithospermum erythrorhizon]|nr:hypothetical protein Leryth_017952 [Lithospermum erythrorhizon]